jgi:hypothetical protein
LTYRRALCQVHGQSDNTRAQTVGPSAERLRRALILIESHEFHNIYLRLQATDITRRLLTIVHSLLNLILDSQDAGAGVTRERASHLPFRVFVSLSTRIPNTTFVANGRRSTEQKAGSGWSDLWDSGEADLWDRGFPSPPLIDFLEGSQKLLKPVDANGQPKKAFVPVRPTC